MLTRVLLWALLILLIFRALGRLVRGIAEGADSTGPRRRPSGSGSTVAKGELMVRDPVCGTFVVQSRALSARGKDGAQYFCSETCRQSFLSR